MIDNAKGNISNNEFDHSLNPISDPYSRINNDYIPTEKRISKGEADAIFAKHGLPITLNDGIFVIN